MYVLKKGYEKKLTSNIWLFQNDSLKMELSINFMILKPILDEFLLFILHVFSNMLAKIKTLVLYGTIHICKKR